MLCLNINAVQSTTTLWTLLCMRDPKRRWGLWAYSHSRPLHAFLLHLESKILNAYWNNDLLIKTRVVIVLVGVNASFINVFYFSLSFKAWERALLLTMWGLTCEEFIFKYFSDAESYNFHSSTLIGVNFYTPKATHQNTLTYKSIYIYINLYKYQNILFQISFSDF